MSKTYFVYRERTHEWLHFDEKTWTKDINEAAEFTDRALARDIGVREAPDESIWVLEP